MSPRPSMVPESEQANMASDFAQQQHQQHAQQLQQQLAKQQAAAAAAAEPGKPPSRAGACRVCLKSFKPDDYSRTCYECQQRVCEDCASYSKLDESEDAVRRTGGMASHCNSIRDVINSILTILLSLVDRPHGGVACAAGRWPLASAYRKTRPIRCSTCP